VSGLFEAVMYIFVFMWTPALERLSPAISHGFVFAVFMVWKMVGSYLFLVCGDAKSLMGLSPIMRNVTAYTPDVVHAHTAQLVHGRFGLENTAVMLFFVGAACLVTPIVSDDYTHTLAAFCVFEMVIGVYWPTIGTLRSKYIDDKVCQHG
jgi:hypothetical protein